MKTRSILGAIVAFSAGGLAHAGDLTLNLGTFENAGSGNIHYTGDYAALVSSGQEGGTGEFTRIILDLDALLLSNAVYGIAWVSIIDTGDNYYNSAPGADIDLFAFANLTPGVTATYSYFGPTPDHQNETHAQLLQRAHALDWPGNGGLSGMTWVSLGDQGRLTLTLSDLVTHGTGADGLPIELHFGEAGSPERFMIEIGLVAVPAPGALALLGLAGLTARQRRRRG